MKKYPNININIFSEEGLDISIYKKIKNCNIYLSRHTYNQTITDLEKIYRDWSYMIYSDIFVGSRSGFSIIPAMLNKNIVIYDKDYTDYPIPNSILYDNQTGKLLSTNF